MRPLDDEPAGAALRAMDAAEVAERAPELVTVQRSALAASTGAPVRDDRVDIVRRHVQRPRFRAVVAEQNAGGPVAGFAYGYREPRDGWWDSAVRPALRAVGEEALLDDAWCLTELHVRPDRQGSGLGRRLLAAVLEGVAGRRVVCSTEAGANPARGFYAHLGFREVAPVRFGDGEHDDYLVLARALPLGRSCAAPAVR